VYELFKHLLSQKHNLDDKYPRVNGLTVNAVDTGDVEHKTLNLTQPTTSVLTTTRVL
jgi:hypothetical protein